MKRVPALSIAAILTLTLTACASNGAAPQAVSGSEVVSVIAQPAADSLSSSLVAVGPATASTSTAPQPADLPSRNPCDLLSEQEVSEALGTPVTAEFIDHGQPTGAKQCLWASKGTELENYSISITTTPDMAQAWRDSGLTAAGLYDQTKGLQDTTPLDGIGDEAVLAPSQVLALKGDSFVTALALFGTSEEAIIALTNLTTKAVSAL